MILLVVFHTQYIYIYLNVYTPTANMAQSYQINQKNRMLNWIKNIIKHHFWANTHHDSYMGNSEKSGTSKSSILIGFSIINHPIWGTPIFGNIHIFPISNTCHKSPGHSARRPGLHIPTLLLQHLGFLLQLWKPWRSKTSKHGSWSDWVASHKLREPPTRSEMVDFHRKS